MSVLFFLSLLRPFWTPTRQFMTLNASNSLSTEMNWLLCSSRRFRPPNSPPLLAPPILCGGTLCGFVPDMTRLKQATANLILEHRDELLLGSETKACMIGSINNEGIFWVRILTPDSAVQEIMLVNLCSTIW